MHFSGHTAKDLCEFQQRHSAWIAEQRYPNFEALVAGEPAEGLTYSRVVRYINSEVSVIAPHGGFIEPQTEKIAQDLAGSEFNLYIFQALQIDNPRCLHITSSDFDDPQCLNLCRLSRIVVTVHGCADNDHDAIYIGGLDQRLKSSLLTALKSIGLNCDIDRLHPGKHPNNICNQGTTGQGLQLEITRRLRQSYAAGSFRNLIPVIRNVLFEAQQAPELPRIEIAR